MEAELSEEDGLLGCTGGKVETTTQQANADNNEIQIINIETNADTEKFDGILETIRGPNTIVSKPETPEDDVIELTVSGVRVTISGEHARAIKREVW